MAGSLVPARLTPLGPGHRLPELGSIDLVLLTNPRTEDRPAVRALIATVLASGSRSLTAYREPASARDEAAADPVGFPRLPADLQPERGRVSPVGPSASAAARVSGWRVSVTPRPVAHSSSSGPET